MHPLMYVLITNKGEKKSNENKGSRVVRTLYSYILDAQVQLTRVLQIIKLIQAFMGVLVTCNDPISKQTYLKVLIFFQPLFEGKFTLTPEWVTNTKLP